MIEELLAEIIAGHDNDPSLDTLLSELQERMGRELTVEERDRAQGFVNGLWFAICCRGGETFEDPNRTSQKGLERMKQGFRWG
jgi:hypothetical protein